MAIFRYRLGPYCSVNILAICMTWLELVCAAGILLPFRKWRLVALLMLIGMLSVFTAVVAWGIYRGIDISCGCFSVNPEADSIGWFNIVRNAVIMTLGAFLFAYEYAGCVTERARRRTLNA